MDPGDLPAFTYSIADPYDPGSIKGTRSTSFKFPGTNRNKVALGSEVMSEDPPTDSIIRIGNEGHVFVEAQVRPVEWSEDEIRAVAVANNGSWASEMKRVKVRDLDFGESDEITAELQSGTWEDEEGVLYFPLINYGYDWTSAVNVSIDQLRPALRAWRVLSEAFGNFGYTIKAKGGFARVWKKFVLPAVSDPSIAQSTIDGNVLTLEQNVESDTYSAPFDFIGNEPDTVTDPGGNLAAVHQYASPFNQTFSMRVTGTLTAALTGDTLFQVLVMRTLPTPTEIAAQGATIPITVANPTVDIDVTISPVSADQADRHCAGIRFFNSGFVSSYTITNLVVTFTPVEPEYGENVRLDIAGCGPDVSIADVLKGMSIPRLLAVTTNDIAKEVTLQYWDEKFITPEVDGWDIRGREDFTDRPVKMDPLKPRRLLYKWKEDGSDERLAELDSIAGERGWGGYIHTYPRGVLDDKKVDIPFAATAMKSYRGEVFVPVMDDREDEDAEYKPRYRWTPRILLSDGLARGSWTFDGSLQDFYPKCFFVYPGETELTMAIDQETYLGDVGPGLASLYHARHLRRTDESKSLEIDLFLYDDELPELDFGVPVFVHDGAAPGWYYFTEIKQKRYGVDEPTRCELIQV